MNTDPTAPEPSSPGTTVVIGAGLAGLSCGVRLHEAGRTVKVLEASDGVGGRVRTDLVNGFLLDRGFQVYLDAYPEAREFLDLEALDLRPFDPGALVWKNGGHRPVMDVFRRPGTLFKSAFQPIGSVFDKLLVAKLRWVLMRKPIEEIWSSPEQSTEAYLRGFGFSERMIDDFFRGFYGGIFLEDELATSSRMFEFTFKMFSLGNATLPAKGMSAIPKQLASRLPPGAIEFGTSVHSISGNRVSTGKGGFDADHLVVATDANVARRLLPEFDLPEPQWKSTVCLQYAADRPPFSQPIIALKGDRSGAINNVCVSSNIAPDYAPPGKALVCVSVLGSPEAGSFLEAKVQSELLGWFGEGARHWKLLRMETIPRALPVSTPGNSVETGCQQIGSRFICGDHTTSGSIEGAIISGLRVANAIIASS